jgi:hypothetical protein
MGRAWSTEREWPLKIYFIELIIIKKPKNQSITHITTLHITNPGIQS